MLSGTFKRSYESDDWGLHDGSGERKIEIYQEFSTPFVKQPSVSISLSEIDSGAGPLRVRVSATEVGTRGFKAVIETWADSVLYAAAVSWIAYEP
ncbi:MAG TPA: H-type lectin domain-containing protein [Caulobacteraceae bacterium]|jgi:hypothetical protein|nr:H-type lectin domain-containing protein [Caulobacteraceae bacterium]